MKWRIGLLLLGLLLSMAGATTPPQPLLPYPASDENSSIIQRNNENLEYHRYQLYDGTASLEVKSILINGNSPVTKNIYGSIEATSFTTNNVDITNRYVASKTYSTAVISLGTATDASFKSVDDTNAAIVFMPPRPGYYRATFIFGDYCTGTTGAQLNYFVYWRLSNRTVDGPSLASGIRVGGVAGTSSLFMGLTNITHSFYCSKEVSVKVKLEKQISSATNIDTHLMLSDNSSGRALYMLVEEEGQ